MSGWTLPDLAMLIGVPLGAVCLGVLALTAIWILSMKTDLKMAHLEAEQRDLDTRSRAQLPTPRSAWVSRQTVKTVVEEEGRTVEAAIEHYGQARSGGLGLSRPEEQTAA